MIWIQTIIIVVAVGLVVFLIDWLLLPDRKARTTGSPRHLNERIADDINEAARRVSAAKANLDKTQSDIARQEAAVDAASPPDPNLASQLESMKQEAAKAKHIVEYEERRLDRLVNPEDASLAIDWGPVFQYIVFGSLALFVLWHLMNGMSSSPPAGTTARYMITFLITVVTVGIALILVLATIISSSEDRERRFSQGKEILTALLGVLGTIVGFYYGSTSDALADLTFDPVVITRETDGQYVLSTSIRGGEAPYSYAISFPDTAIEGSKGETENGKIVAHFSARGVDVVTVRLTAEGAGGKKGAIQYSIELSGASDTGAGTSSE